MQQLVGHRERRLLASGALRDAGAQLDGREARFDRVAGPQQLAPGIVDRSGSFTLDAAALLGGRPQEVGPGEIIIYKPRWSAFFETPLEDHLRRSGVSTVVFCGCNFPNCPRTSIYEASERDFRIVLVEDAISGLYGKGRRELENIGVRLMPTAGVTNLLRSRAPVASA